METLTLSNGFVLRYVSSGSGPALVLVHTIRTQLEYFQQLVAALTAHYRVYVLDLPGHGDSSILRTEYTEELFRRSVSEFIETLDLRDVTLAGESIGGVLALTVAATLPERVTRAIAFNPYDYGERFGGGIRRSRNGWIVGLFRVFGARTPEPRFVLEAVLKGGFRDASALSPDLLTAFHRSGLRPDYRRMEHSLFRNWKTWVDARTLYSRITVPVTLVYSSNDWSGPEDRRRNRRTIPHARSLEIANAGHFASLERPEQVASILLSRSLSGKQRAART